MVSRDARGNDRRIEQRLDDRQRNIILEMYERDEMCDFVMERFEAYDLTPDGIKEIVSQERAKRRAKDAACTDWAKRYAEFRAAS